MSLMNPMVEEGNNQVFFVPTTCLVLTCGLLCIIIYIFMEVLRPTRIQIFVNEGCSFESDSISDRESV